MTTVIILIQIIALFKYLKDNLSAIIKNDNLPTPTSVPNDRMAYATYFFSLLNFIFIGIMTIVLEFFSTDG